MPRVLSADIAGFVEHMRLSVCPTAMFPYAPQWRILTMKTKITLNLVTVLFSALFAVSAFAVDVPGKIFYVDGAGKLVKRAVTIDVPARGEGKVVLKGKRIRWESDSFTSTTVHGQKVFSVVFTPEWEGKKKYIKFVGTYLKGSNKLVYYGSFYKKKSLAEMYRYAGGFAFKYDRE